jgi:hypothetical protein
MAVERYREVAYSAVNVSNSRRIMLGILTYDANLLVITPRKG